MSSYAGISVEWFIFMGSSSLIIVFARVIDVTLGTLRIIFVSRGDRTIAPILGFFETLIWVVVISQIMQNLNNPMTYIAYALGFALGNYIGISVEDKLAIGHLVVRIFVTKDEDEIMKKIIDAGFGVTSLKGKGATDEVTVLYSLIKRKNLDSFLEVINISQGKIFYSVESAKEAHLGIHPTSSRSMSSQRREIIRKLLGGFSKRK